MSVWTDEKMAKLEKLLIDGLSASQIAQKLGVFGHCVDGGRSAVIGKIRRLGLEFQTPKKRTGVAKPTNPIKQMRQPAAKTRVSPALPDVPPSEPVLVAPHLLGILDLEPHHCRWPENSEAPFHFCGAQRADGSPYCSEHHARAFVKPVRTKQPFAFRRLAA